MIGELWGGAARSWGGFCAGEVVRDNGAGTGELRGREEGESASRWRIFNCLPISLA
jgi:hypothetical protein